jgi:hypothetical protein
VVIGTDGEEGHFLGDTEPYDAVVLIWGAGNGWVAVGEMAPQRQDHAGADFDRRDR